MERRLFYGLAYNNTIKWEHATKQVKARLDGSRKDLYNDSAIRLTNRELSMTEFRGLPIRVEHLTENMDESPVSPVGQVLDAWLDENDGFRIVAEINASTHLGRLVAEQMDKGVFTGLSVGYGAPMKKDGHVIGKMMEEISVVMNPFFEGCNLLTVNASKDKRGLLHKANERPIYLKLVKASRVMSEQNNEPQPMEVEKDTELVRRIDQLKRQLEQERQEKEAFAKRAKRADVYEQQYKEQAAKNAGQVLAMVLEQAQRDLGEKASLPDAATEPIKMLMEQPECNEAAAVLTRCSNIYEQMKKENSQLKEDIKKLSEENKEAKATITASKGIVSEAEKMAAASLEAKAAAGGGQRGLDSIVDDDWKNSTQNILRTLASRNSPNKKSKAKQQQEKNPFDMEQANPMLFHALNNINNRALSIKASGLDERTKKLMERQKKNGGF